MEVILNLIENLTAIIGPTNFAIAVEGRLKNNTFRKKIEEELCYIKEELHEIKEESLKARKNEGRIIDLIDAVEGKIYMKLNSTNNNALTMFQTTEKENSVKAKKNSQIQTKLKSIPENISTPITFLLKYTRRKDCFLNENAIVITIPANSRDFFQLNVIKIKIDINKQLYFQIENLANTRNKKFKTPRLEETDYKKIIHIISYKKHSELFVEIKIDGVIYKGTSVAINSNKKLYEF